MKAAVVTLAFFIMPLKLLSQVVAVQNISQANTAMLCMYTDFIVAVEGYMSDSIIVSTDNGLIIPNEYSKGHYHLKPQEVGNAMVYVKDNTIKRKGYILDSIRFFVKRIPLSIPRLGGMTGGNMTQEYAVMQIGLSAQIECCGFDARFKIISHTVRVVRHKKEIFKRTITNPDGVRIDSVTKDFFYRLKNKDKLLFEDIIISDCDGVKRTLESISFTITDAHKYKDIEVHDVYVADPITGEETHFGKKLMKRRKK